jgi:hypothetical protein
MSLNLKLKFSKKLYVFNRHQRTQPYSLTALQPYSLTMSSMPVEFIKWLLELTLSQNVEFADTTHLCSILLYNAELIRRNITASHPDAVAMVQDPCSIFSLRPDITRAVWFFLTGEDTEGVWTKQTFNRAWRLDAVVGKPITELRSLLDARVAAFNRADPMRTRVAVPAPRIEPVGAAHPLAPRAAPAVSTITPVLPAAAAPAVAAPLSHAERLNALGERLWHLVTAQFFWLGSGVSAGKIVGMLLDALKDDEEELNAIIGSTPLLLSYIADCNRTLEEASAALQASAPSPPTPAAAPAPAPFFGPTPAEAAQARRDAAARRAATAAARPTLNAAAKKLVTYAAANTLATSLAAILSAQSDVTISRDTIEALARRTAREALGLAPDPKPP